MKNWYTIKAAAAGSDTAEVSVYDYIGYYGVRAIDFLNEIKNVEAPNIRVLINSPGGDVFDAIAMVNGLRMSGKKVTTTVMGLAASAASYLMLAGDHRVMPSNAMQMVHNASSGAYGNAEELTAVVEALHAVDNSLHATYMDRTGMTKEQVVELLSKDTFLTAEQCLEMGLCDEVTPAVKMTASYEVDRLPANVQALFKAAALPQPTVTSTLADDVAGLVRDAGLETFSATFVTDERITSMESAAPVINAAREIVALAKHTGQDAMVEGLIRGRKTLPEARAAIAAALEAASPHVDTSAPSKQVASPSADKWTPRSQWAEIHAMKSGAKK